MTRVGRIAGYAALVTAVAVAIEAIRALEPGQVFSPSPGLLVTMALTGALGGAVLKRSRHRSDSPPVDSPPQ